MKKYTLAYFSIMTVLTIMAACNKNEGNNPPPANAYATTPQACNVMGNPNLINQQQYGQQPYYPQYGQQYNQQFGQSYYGQQYNSYGTNVPTQNSYYCDNNIYGTNGGANTNWAHGQWYWPTQWQSTQANCGCPVGFTSVYAPQFGVACAPAAYSQSWGVVYYNYNWYWGPAQNSYQLNNPQAQYVTSSSSCQNAAQGCDTRLNNCPSGSFCQAAGGGSTIGLCVRSY